MDYATSWLTGSIMGLTSKSSESSGSASYANAARGTNPNYPTSRHDQGNRPGALGDYHPSPHTNLNAYNQLQRKEVSGRVNQPPVGSSFFYDPKTKTGEHRSHEIWTPTSKTHPDNKSSNSQKHREPSPPPARQREATPPPTRPRTPPLSKPPSDPASIVLHGKQLTISYDGTSQYAQGGGVSACGLAALNCARIVLGQSKQGILEAQLLEDIISERTVQEIVSICPMWTGSAHLEVDEIAELPIFSNFLEQKGVNWGKATRSGFNKMLRRQEEAHDYPAVVSVITKSPEIIACLRITIQERNVFIIFDSHSRPSHPNGSGLVIDADRERILDRLVELMGVDEDLLNDPEFAWQMEMLSSFSDHRFVPKAEDLDLKSIILQLSVQAYAKKHDADEQLRPIREERDKLSSQLREWRAYAETQAAKANAFKQEAEKIHRQTLRDFDAQRTTMTREVDKLRSQAQEAEQGRAEILAQFDQLYPQLRDAQKQALEANATIAHLNQELSALKSQANQAPQPQQVQEAVQVESGPPQQVSVQDVPHSSPSFAHSPRSERSSVDGFTIVEHETGGNPSECDVVMTDSSDDVKEDIAQQKKSRSDRAPSEDKKSRRSNSGKDNDKSSKR